MANTKRRCAHCKEYFLVGGDGIKTPAGYFCSFEHASQYAKTKALKTKQKEEREAKKAYNAETKRLKALDTQRALKTRKRAAKEACHAYIRERDKYQSCICCGRPFNGDMQAGHFYTDGNHPFIRYHEDNIHGQKLNCNYFEGGGRADKYRENLVAKIGIERVEWLEANKSKPIKRTAEDYKEIERYYKRKLRELKESRGE